MKRWIPIIVILALMAITYFTGFHQSLSYEAMQEHRTELKSMVELHPFASPLIYIAVYIISTALSIPGAIFLSIFGGFLFPQPFSTLYVVIGATLGAILIFLAAKTALGSFMKGRAGPLLQKMHRGFHKDASNYLLFLRLVPIFPFWLINLAPAFFGVSLWIFTWTTFVGIIPGAFVFTQAGVGLGAILDSGESLTIETIFNTQVKIAVAALGIFALLPIFLKKIWRPS